MEHCTALVEYLDGRIELVDHTWLEGQPTVQEEPAQADTPFEPAIAAMLAPHLSLADKPRVA
jgi:hypothetical protein